MRVWMYVMCLLCMSCITTDILTSTPSSRRKSPLGNSYTPDREQQQQQEETPSPPPKKSGSEESKDESLGRAMGLLGLALAVLFAGNEVEATGGAALAVIVMSAAAARFWNQEDSAATQAVGAHLNALWLQLAQPLLFALIGAAVDFTRLSGDVVAKGLLIVFVGVTVRSSVAFLAAGGGHLEFHDRVFVAVAWTPKATVQAALAGLPYDAAVTSFGRDSEEADNSEVLLALGVLAIIVTAPLGAAAVAMSGPRLLKKKKEVPRADEATSGEM